MSTKKTHLHKPIDYVISITYFGGLLYISYLLLGTPINEFIPFQYDDEYITRLLMSLLRVLMPWIVTHIVIGITTYILASKSLTTRSAKNANSYIGSPQIVKKEDFIYGQTNKQLSCDKSACYMTLGVVYMTDQCGKQVGTISDFTDFTEAFVNGPRD